MTSRPLNLVFVLIRASSAVSWPTSVSMAD